METDPYPWRLRIFHEGQASLRVERPGRWLHFDPLAPEDDPIVLLTAGWPERLRGTEAAVRAGRKLTVGGPEPVLDRLEAVGEIERLASPSTPEGLLIQCSPYPPGPEDDAVAKLGAALRKPASAARRLAERLDGPHADPVWIGVTLPDGSRLLHLGTALHDRADPAAIDRLKETWQGVDWLIVGVDFGQDDAVMAHAGEFGARIVLVTDLVNDARAGLGLPTHLLTPVVDELVARDVPAFPFPPGASYRFE